MKGLSRAILIFVNHLSVLNHILSNTMQDKFILGMLLNSAEINSGLIAITLSARNGVLLINAVITTVFIAPRFFLRELGWLLTFKNYQMISVDTAVIASVKTDAELVNLPKKITELTMTNLTTFKIVWC